MSKNKILSIILLCGMIISESAAVTSTVYATVDFEQQTEQSAVITNDKTPEKKENNDKKTASADKSVTETVQSSDNVTLANNGSQTVAGEFVETPASTGDGSSATSAETVASSTPETSSTNTDEKKDAVDQSSTKDQTSQPSSTSNTANQKPAANNSSVPATSSKVNPSVKAPAVTTNQGVANSVPTENTIASSTASIESFSNVVLDDAIIVSNQYVDHWSGQDAYTHNLLSKRFGISAEQLDGFLQSTGIDYDSNRFNGENLLKWEKESGLDVRAIVAIAIAESSLGTAGVAKDNQANAFGYGAFDNNPDNAKRFNDEEAIKALTKISIIKNKNNTFKRQDDKARQLANGQLDVAKDGGVYFTDTSGTGKRRAKVMEDLDRWIDQHGGTPKAPALANTLISSGSIASSIPEGFNLSASIDKSGYTAATYPWGQCTWYVYNRAQEFGIAFSPFMGNGGDWRLKLGYETSHEPKQGAAVSFAPGQAGADATYGHVAFVEDVREDGSILISESNVTGLGNISFRTFSAQEAKQLTYVFGQK